MAKTIIQASELPYQTHKTFNNGSGKHSYELKGDVPIGANLTFYGDVIIHDTIKMGATIRAFGKITVEGRIADSVTLEGNSIHANHGGRDITMVAHKTNIDAGNFGECCKLSANGDVNINNAGSCLHTTCNGRMTFQRIEDHAVLRASALCGDHVNDDTVIIATDGDIQLHSTGARTKITTTKDPSINHPGEGLRVNIGKKPYELSFTPRPEPVKIKTLIGCGIHKLSDTSYIITKKTGAQCGEENVARLIYELCDLGATPKDISGQVEIIQDAATEITLPESFANQTSARALITDFIARHRERQ